ncbi:response regulator [Paenibacillus sp. KS-LC4]|uniref:response regulator n=1 Tax=Paenibacillus sp. KS-LC4 TaxID=2979727 RepID=UPI0030D27F60
MSISFVIVDDDAVSRRMLHNIIEQSSLGEVLGTAKGGIEAVMLIDELKPDVVLIDMLMPDQDGITTIDQLRAMRYGGKFIMISQIDNKDMVGKAYRSGIEFFIHKPINRVEVQAVLHKMNESWKYERYVTEMKQSLAKLDIIERPPAVQERSIREAARHILMDMGIISEAGSRDMIAAVEYLSELPQPAAFPPLKGLYEAVARTSKQSQSDIDKESKAIEQRMRRAVMTALTNIASIGLTDYSNPKFEHYAPLYFDFKDVRLKMKMMDEEATPDKGKVNIKKFLQVFFMEAMEKNKQA